MGSVEHCSLIVVAQIEWSNYALELSERITPKTVPKEPGDSTCPTQLDALVEILEAESRDIAFGLMRFRADV